MSTDNKEAAGQAATVAPPGADSAMDATIGAPPSGLDATVASEGDAAADDLDRDARLPVVRPAYYRIDRELSRGGMGRILVACDRRMDRTIALKEATSSTRQARARFEREALITGRLQHPGIVPVYEAGSWPNGELFYAMKLVEGRPLRRCIDDARELNGRLALLPNLVAVADALSYAHARRVIHRDLKPDNVLVGDYGETVIIDWGLAKQLDEPDAEPDGDTDGTSAPDATVAGTALGTPVYMPPEQARGEPADTRSDVYAVGAMLYHLLAGRVPYHDSRSSMEVLERVLAGAPTSIRSAAPEAPADLVTIVEKAMAREPADRYPSARELADDLRRYTTGQLVGAHHYSAWQLLRRWIRKHRTAVIVAAVAGLALAVFAVVSVGRIVREEARTAQQRQIAEDSRAEAEDLMSFMLGDLREKLQPLGKLEVLESVARRAERYYAHRAASTDHEQLGRGEALTNLGDVLAPQGDLAGALVQYRAALAIHERLAAADPSSSALAARLATSHEKVGEVLLAQGDVSGGVAATAAGLAIRDRLATNDPKDGDHQRALATSRRKHGEALVASGNTTGARDVYRAGLAILEIGAAARVAGRREDRRWQTELSLVHKDLGDVLQRLGDTNNALVHYRASVAIKKALVAASPSDALLRAELAVGHDRIGTVLRTIGNPAGALEEHRTALAIMQQLATQDPQNAPWQGNLASAHHQIGNLLVARGDLDGAFAEHQAAFAIVEQLVARDPSSAQWPFDLAIAHDRLAAIHQKRGRIDLALAALRASVALREDLVARDARNTDARHALAIGRQLVGNAVYSQGDVAGALVEYRAALAAAEQLVRDDPDNEIYRGNVASFSYMVGFVLQQQGDVVGALAPFRVTEGIWVAQAAADPSNVQLRARLAIIRTSLGEVQQAQGDTVGALAAFRGSLAELEEIQRQDPTDLTNAASVFDGHLKVGHLLQQRGDPRGALVEFRACLALAEHHSARNRDNFEWARYVGVSHGAIGRAMLDTGDATGALDGATRYLGVVDALLAKDATSALARRDQIDAHRDVGTAYLRLGQPARALPHLRRSLAGAVKLAAAEPGPQAQKVLAIAHDKVGDAVLATRNVSGALAAYETARALRERILAADPDDLEARIQLVVGREKIGDALVAAQRPAAALETYRAALAIATELANRDPTDRGRAARRAQLQEKLSSCCK